MTSSCDQTIASYLIKNLTIQYNSQLGQLNNCYSQIKNISWTNLNVWYRIVHILIVLLEKIVNSRNLQYFQLQNRQNCRVIFSTFYFYLLNINFNFTRIFEPLWVRNKNLPFFSQQKISKKKQKTLITKRLCQKIQNNILMIFFFLCGNRSKSIYFLLNYTKLAKDDIICTKD